MELASKERMITFAMVGLCAVIGVLSLLAVVYYGQASDIQNNLNMQTSSLEAQIEELQNEKDLLQSQVTTLQGDKTNLQSQVNSLTTSLTNANTEINSLTGQVGSLTEQVQDLNGQVAKQEAAIAAAGERFSHSNPIWSHSVAE